MVEELSEDETAENQEPEVNDLGELPPPQEDEFGPPLKGATDGLPIGLRDQMSGTVARNAYNDTLREFRETGRATPKAPEDFAHIINPKLGAIDAYHAHRKALEHIEAWTQTHGARPVPDISCSGPDASSPEPDVSSPEEEKADELAGPELPADGATCAETPNNPYTDDMRRAAAGASSGVLQTALEPVTLRGEVFNPKARPIRFDGYGPTRQLDVSRSAALLRPPAGSTDEDTQGWLNAILGECHFLMQEVMFRSICATDKLDDRLGIVRQTMDVAKTAAKVGKSIAELKREKVLEARRKTTVEHVESVSMKGRST